MFASLSSARFDFQCRVISLRTRPIFNAAPSQALVLFLVDAEDIDFPVVASRSKLSVSTDSDVRFSYLVSLAPV